VRKQDPNDIIHEFRYRVASHLDTWQRLSAVGLSGDLRRAIAVDAFFRMAAAFEAFRSDWHVASLNRDSSTLKRHLGKELATAIKRSGWPGLTNHVTINLPRHPRLEVVREIVDPLGAHLNFGDRWVQRCSQELIASYAGKVAALPAADHSFVRLVISLRNCIAHGSVRASREFNDALAAVDPGVDADLMRGRRLVHPSGIGSYLNAQRAAGRRVELYARRLDGLAAKLSV
jgi:hypothetical protein